MHHLGTKQLETERLILRTFQLTDAEDMFANWVTDPEVTRFWSWEPHKDIATTKGVLQQWIDEYEKEDTYHWVIVCKSNMQAIGYIYLSDIDDYDDSASVHYALSRAYWSQGMMSEACKRVIDFAFKEVGFERIHTHHHIDNPASGKVMQKAGMKYVRTEYRKTETERLCGDYAYYEIRMSAEIRVSMRRRDRI